MPNDIEADFANLFREIDVLKEDIRKVKGELRHIHEDHEHARAIDPPQHHHGEDGLPRWVARSS